ncbi:MAG: DNA-binding response regulator [Candidatus Scalindua rubra]|uniref:DNA-binding response regulator n=1 Tax=Candidatus Scalindua rubra TaxID=1872076 RepID=A0A1E3XGP3_9BACT|nr:MAG: DNA-binding response regulator [Candidatus Scalindua rubra]
MSIRIVLADDHRIVRDGLRSLLEKQPDMEVVAEAEDGRTAVQKVLEILPDVVIMDVSMNNLNGIEATRQIIEKSPRIKVLALSMYSDMRFVSGMFSAGASGYLMKDSTFKELVDAIRVVISNQIYLSPRITDIVTKNYIHRLSKTNKPVSPILTVRELEIVKLLVEGKTIKQVAMHLNVSVKVFETYRRKIMEKLNIYKFN